MERRQFILSSAVSSILAIVFKGFPQEKNELRTVERLSGSTWKRIEWKDIKENDTIRIFEPDGTPIKDNNVFTVALKPSLTENGIYSVSVVPHSTVQRKLCEN